MAFPIAHLRSRVLPQAPVGPGFLEAAAGAFGQEIEGQRQRRREDQLLAEQRDFSESMVRLQDELAGAREEAAFARQQPYMETPREARVGQAGLALFGSTLRRGEMGFEHQLGEPHRAWQRGFAERGLGLQEQEFGHNSLMDVLRLNLQAKAEGRLQSLADAELAASGAPGGIPAGVMSTLISSGAIDPSMLLEGGADRDAITALDRYFREGILPEEREAPDVADRPGFFSRMRERFSLPERGGTVTPGGITFGGPAPTPARGPSGAGGGARLLEGGGTATSEGLQQHSRLPEDVVGPAGKVPDDFFRGMSAQEHVELLQSNMMPASDIPGYIERLYEVDPQLGAEVQRLLGR
jgi:hypothetical protein